MRAPRLRYYAPEASYRLHAFDVGEARWLRSLAATALKRPQANGQSIGSARAVSDPKDARSPATKPDGQMWRSPSRPPEGPKPGRRPVASAAGVEPATAMEPVDQDQLRPAAIPASARMARDASASSAAPAAEPQRGLDMDGTGHDSGGTPRRGSAAGPPAATLCGQRAAAKSAERGRSPAVLDRRPGSLTPRGNRRFGRSREGASPGHHATAWRNLRRRFSAAPSPTAGTRRDPRTTACTSGPLCPAIQCQGG